MSSPVVPAVMARVPEIAHRLQQDQKFNIYELSSGGYTVCLGPVTDLLTIADVRDERVAEILEAALRTMAGQPVAKRGDHHAR